MQYSLHEIQKHFDGYLCDQQLLSLKDLLNDSQMPKGHEQIVENRHRQDNKKHGPAKDDRGGPGGKHGARGAEQEPQAPRDAHRRSFVDKHEGRQSFTKPGRGSRGGHAKWQVKGGVSGA